MPEPTLKRHNSDPRAPELNEFLPDNYFRRWAVPEIFGNEAPLEVDLGSGDGTFLIDLARQNPERNFLGVERLLGRVRKTCRKAERAGLSNVRVLRLESAYTAEWLLERGMVDRLHLLFPDPWPKKRHHKNRLVNAAFLKVVASLLAEGGEFCFKTDHPGYYEWVVEHVEESGLFDELPWNDDDEEYPLTDFERQWLGEGKSIQKLRLGLRAK
jgi:tRNA (guanine-N7-)-methyltransferase